MARDGGPRSGVGAGRGVRFPSRFEVRRVIGRGGAGVVYEAWDHRLRRLVALKVLQVAVENPVPEERGEAQVLASLTHPNLITVFDTFLTPVQDQVPAAVLVLELVDGPDLHQLLRTAVLTAGQVAQIGVQLCSALSYVHGRGFLHQDVKPSNVLLTFRGAEVAAKLSDFGTAVLLSSADDQGDFTIGTAAYLSPEQAAGRELTAASDVYALGLVLLEAVTGVVAFPGTVIDAAMARLDVDPEVPEEVPAELRDILIGMTRRDPAERLALDAVRRRLDRYSLRVQTEEDPDAGAVPSAAGPAAPRPSGAAERPRRAIPTFTGGGATARFFRPQEVELTRLLELAVLLFSGTGAAVLERVEGHWQHRVAIDLPELATTGLRQQLTERRREDPYLHQEAGARLLVSAVPHDADRCLVVQLQRDARVTGSTMPQLVAVAEVLAAALQLRDAFRRALFAG